MIYGFNKVKEDLLRIGELGICFYVIYFFFLYMYIMYINIIFVFDKNIDIKVMVFVLK